MNDTVIRRATALLAALCLSACAHNPSTQPAAAAASKPATPTPTNPYANVPQDVMYTCGRTVAEWNAEHYAEVANLARQCLAYRDLPVPLKAVAQSTLGGAEFVLGHYPAALDAVQASIELTPKPVDAQYLMLAAAYRGNRHYDESLATLDKLYAAHEVAHDTATMLGMPYYYHRGWTLAEMGRPQDAIASYTQGIPYQPAYASVYLRRAQAREAAGDTTGARADYVQFVRWAAPRETDAPIRAKLAALKIDPDTERRRPFGEANPLREAAASRLADAQKSLGAATQPVARAPALWLVAVELDNVGRHEEALKAVDQALQLGPNQAFFYTQTKITILLSMNRARDAIAVAQLLLDKVRAEAKASARPADTYKLYEELFASTSAAYSELGDWDDAISTLAETAQASAPTEYDYLTTVYLYVRAKSGGNAPTNEIFETLLRRANQPLPGSYRRTLLLYWQGQATLDQVQGQITLLRDATARQNALAEMWFLAGARMKYVTNDTAGARDCLSRINSLAPYGTTDWLLAKRDLT
jgi:tetratricopeptide (TPR) repeat protein